MKVTLAAFSPDIHGSNLAITQSWSYVLVKANPKIRRWWWQGRSKRQNTHLVTVERMAPYPFKLFDTWYRTWFKHRMASQIWHLKQEHYIPPYANDPPYTFSSLQCKRKKIHISTVMKTWFRIRTGVIKPWSTRDDYIQIESIPRRANYIMRKLV